MIARFFVNKFIGFSREGTLDDVLLGGCCRLSLQGNGHDGHARHLEDSYSIIYNPLYLLTDGFRQYIYDNPYN